MNFSTQNKKILKQINNIKKKRFLEKKTKIERSYLAIKKYQ